MRINVIGIGAGTIINIRFDDRNEAIFTIQLDDANITPDGLFVARAFELDATGEVR